MSDDTKDASGKRRIEIEDLPRDEQELSADEQKSVQGGATRVVTPGIRTQVNKGGSITEGGPGEEEEILL